MKVRAGKFAPLMLLSALAAFASVAPSQARAADGLLEFNNFECPGDCPAGAELCCAHLPPCC